MKRLLLILPAVLLLSLLAACGQVPQPGTTPAGTSVPRTSVWGDPAAYVGQEVTVEGVLEAEGQGRDVHFFLRGTGEARLEVSAWAPLEVMHPPSAGTPTPKIMLDYVGKNLRLTGVVTQAANGYVLTVAQAEELQSTE